MPAVLLDPVLADGTCVVFAPAAQHRPNHLVGKERPTDCDSS